MFSIAEDIQALGRVLSELRDVVLVIVDPISAYLGKTDSHKNAEVRAVLAPLAELAAKFNVAILGITHLSKASGPAALMRVMGSVAFVAAARAAWLVTNDPQDNARRLFLPLKNNLGPDQGGLAFRIEAATVQSPKGPIETSRVMWESTPVTLSADEAMQAVDNGREPSALDKAVDWLRETLADRPLASTDVITRAAAVCIAEKTLRRAASKVGIKPAKDGKGGWKWSL
jgi:hypothetical protein